VRGAEVFGLLGQVPHQVFRQWHSMRESLLEGCGALSHDEGVRVLTLRKKEEANLAPLTRLGQRLLQRAPRGGAAGAVPVEGERHGGHEAEYAAEMLGGGGSTERGHRVVDAGLMQADRVHVALDHHESLETAARTARLVQAVELASLVEERRLGRVEVLRLAGVDDTSTKGDDAAARIANRKHHAVAEAVVVALTLPAGAAFAFDDETGVDEA